MSDLSYDAVLVLSFGGPEKPDDVMPFLENVLRGRNVPRERMLAVAEHYYHFDGKSPINDQNRALIARLKPNWRATDCRCPSIGAIAIGIRCSPIRCGKCAPMACARLWLSSPPSLARTRVAANTWRTSSGRVRRWKARPTSTSCANSTIPRYSSKRRLLRCEPRW